MKLHTIALPAALATIVVLAVLGRHAASERHPTDIRTVTIRNACHRVVWLFYGRTPPLRPQDAVTLAGGRRWAVSRSASTPETPTAWT